MTGILIPLNAVMRFGKSKRIRLFAPDVLKSQRGFTLIEMMFVTFIFPTVMLALFAMFEIVADVFYTGDIYYQLNQGCMQTLRYITREIGQTSPLTSPTRLSISTDGSGFSVVRFQIPVDWDADGDVVSGTLDPQVEWGAYTQANANTGGTLGYWVEYRVVNDASLGNQLKRRILDSTLTLVSGTDQVVASNVLTFTATLTSSTLRVTLGQSAQDRVGQRTLTTTFTSDTVLRNAVS